MQNSELDAMKMIDEALSTLPDPKVRDRVLRWAWDKYATMPHPDEPEDIVEQTKKKVPRKKRERTPGSGKRKKKSPSLVKDLDLRPKGKKSFLDFVTEKAPSTQAEQCVVAVYYLTHEAKISKVTDNHVYTCFKHAHWRLPYNLDDRLAWVSSQKGWLDTSTMSDIKLVPAGENLVEHDLPKKPRGGENK